MEPYQAFGHHIKKELIMKTFILGIVLIASIAAFILAVQSNYRMAAAIWCATTGLLALGYFFK
ncbi:hypothetical protein A2333_01050 [Candidatus Wolfebacteria bacterium RIFOXYB2_FULL_49_7]|nr:MAG: hypothetical protein A2333_01050 [Candidatus Wolfebacteria bacterium RIFOXYB2_FULL_49_7]